MFNAVNYTITIQEIDIYYLACCLIGIRAITCIFLVMISSDTFTGIYRHCKPIQRIAVRTAVWYWMTWSYFQSAFMSTAETVHGSTIAKIAHRNMKGFLTIRGSLMLMNRFYYYSEQHKTSILCFRCFGITIRSLLRIGKFQIRSCFSEDNGCYLNSFHQVHK
jgi:hypothetical protein